jgi:hypothetical protein
MSSGTPFIPNPYNLVLAQKHGQLAGAIRFALTTSCNPETGEPNLTGVQVRKQLRLIQINCNTSGENILIPASAGVKQIYEMLLWNVAAQTLMFYQGNGVPLLQLTSFPALSGLTLGFNGSFDQPHWEIDNGQSLVLNLAASTQVDGFIRYRVQNGTY